MRAAAQAGTPLLERHLAIESFAETVTRALTRRAYSRAGGTSPGASCAPRSLRPRTVSRVLLYDVDAIVLARMTPSRALEIATGALCPAGCLTRGCALWQAARIATRPAIYRRRGPDGPLPPSLQRLLDGAADAVNRRLRSHPGWRVAAAASVPLAVGAIAARRRIGMHPALTLPLGCVPPLGCAIAVPKGRRRYTAVAAAYMHLFKLGWELPYDNPERLRRRLWIDEPIRFDTVIGLGVPPGVRLQRALRRPGEVTKFDIAVTAVYGSWFVPQLLLAYLLARHEEFVPRAGARLAAAYHLTCPFYFFAPEAPPWWASEKEGRMGGEIQRVARLVVCDLLKRPPPADGKVPGNPWGSMPSDHISSAAITAMGLREVSPLYGAVGWSYAAAASFAVVYLGEHYVADVVVGLLIAEAVRRAEPLAAPFVRAVARAVE